MVRRLFVAVAFLLTLAPLAAVANSEDYMCRNGLFPSDEPAITLMRATGSARTYFLWDSDTKGCPSETKTCRYSYVLPGQEVLAGKKANGFICAFFPNNSGGSAGWVTASKLTPSPLQPDRNPTLRVWAGKWKNGEDEVDITISGATLVASGLAIWRGMGAGNVNDGAFDARSKPRGAQVAFVDSEASDGDGCHVSARLLGDYLVVADNGQCGGMNVRFDGVYRRSR